MWKNKGHWQDSESDNCQIGSMTASTSHLHWIVGFKNETFNHDCHLALFVQTLVKVPLTALKSETAARHHSHCTNHEKASGQHWNDKIQRSLCPQSNHGLISVTWPATGADIVIDRSSWSCRRWFGSVPKRTWMSNCWLSNTWIKHNWRQQATPALVPWAHPPI